MLKRVIGIGLVFAAGFVAGTWRPGVVEGQEKATEGQRTRIMRWEEARSHVAGWGEMRIYFTGETYAANRMFTAFAVVRPGESVHPAHRHEEEEFLVITDGSGRWHVDGKEFPAAKGDVLYVEPWVMHGLVNTGSEPLTFFVVKYNGKGVAPPPAPPGDHGR